MCLFGTVVTLIGTTSAVQVRLSMSNWKSNVEIIVNEILGAFSMADFVSQMTFHCPQLFVTALAQNVNSLQPKSNIYLLPIYLCIHWNNFLGSLGSVSIYLLWFLFKFILICLLLFKYSCLHFPHHHSPPPQPPPHPTPSSTPLGFFHVLFIHVPENSSPPPPLIPSQLPFGYC